MGRALPLSPTVSAWQRLPLRSRVPGVDVVTLRRWLEDLPPATGYQVLGKPLRYREAPHLAGATWYEERLIELQVPQPFRAFAEKVYYRAQRRPGRPMAFRWFAKTVRFRTRREVLRFLYCHEFYHWYLREVRQRKAAAETACDRFALAHFRRRQAGVDWSRLLPGYEVSPRLRSRKTA
ncbi:MAG TPA: hypothetical protein VET65_13225 [Candidatus Limnocylindrales bacterium]|nr:hypothetical protein [Candidatus Limnocylindrales bacterium]